jgi:hypothetical protein
VRRPPAVRGYLQVTDMDEVFGTATSRNLVMDLQDAQYRARFLIRDRDGACFDFIEGFYNPRRRHSSLGMLSPAEYERRQPQPPVYRSNIELRNLSWGYAAWWYSLITPVTTGLRRMVCRSVRLAVSRFGSVSRSGGRCCRDWCGREAL